MLATKVVAAAIVRLICKAKKGLWVDLSGSAPSLLEGFIGESDLARQLHRSGRALQHLAATRSGPPRIKIGRSVYHQIESIRAWLAQQEKKPAESADMLVASSGALRRMPTIISNSRAVPTSGLLVICDSAIC
jgi:hypothetical protein